MPSVLGEPLLHHRREGVLEAVRLLVGSRPVQPEHVGEPALEQTMPARHGLGDAEALGGEADLLLARQADIAVALHAPERLGDGGRGDVHVPGEARADHRLVAAGEVVDGAEIVLDRRSRFHGAEDTGRRRPRQPRRAGRPGVGSEPDVRAAPGRVAAMDFALTESQELIRKEVAALARAFSLGLLAGEGRQGRVPAASSSRPSRTAGWLGHHRSPRSTAAPGSASPRPR